jgi:hypothetical protein
MGFALGSKINLGSAVGYLLIDPRRFAQGLAKASSDMDNFNKAVALSAVDSGPKTFMPPTLRRRNANWQRQIQRLRTPSASKPTPPLLP